MTAENYGAWAMFFDGVPVPAPVTTNADGTTSGGAAAISFIHQPYLENNCDACHKSKLRFTRRDASGCVSCHTSVPGEYRHMHGPVAAHACLWCHTPHESAFPHLLRESDRALCTRCHTQALLSTERVPAHADETRGCLECHSGHGGSARFMLTAASEAAPASEPTREER